ncbi:hypothetical protein DdX_08577 [Ditylenchus destructor]|uniref:Uncharacterized protein n=1 Tax=Ditylenchus destructor TaxID=166010 RepID=A0AAD4N3K5_9BILA|nr:hypothetical protein DdX_08577 [Ditylenchus destructor]
MALDKKKVVALYLLRRRLQPRGHNSTLSLCGSQTPVYSDINALEAKFLSVLEQQDDQWTQFGKFVGASLSQKSDKKKQRELCMKIHQLLNEYDSD